jgi:hypothetical protein
MIVGSADNREKLGAILVSMLRHWIPLVAMRGANLIRRRGRVKCGTSQAGISRF